MTPNGAIALVIVVVLAAMMARISGLVALYLFTALFAVIEVGPHAALALRRAVILMLPLAAFMILVWVGVVGRAPADIAASQPGSRMNALIYVSIVGARLFLIVAIVQIAAMRFAALTPLQFIQALRAPVALKRLGVLTLSLVETLLQAVDRAHTALIASGVITRRISARNLFHGWVLVQTVWLTAITSVTGRMRDKWPMEHTLQLLDLLLAETHAAPLATPDKRIFSAAVIAVGIKRFSWGPVNLSPAPFLRPQPTVHARAQSPAAPTYFIGLRRSGLIRLIHDCGRDRALSRQGSHHRPVLTDNPNHPRRKPQTLSGGEQVPFALHCFSSGYRALVIDTALEQLDASNRREALHYPMPAIHLTWC